MFKRVAILGLDVIGASIGLTLSRNRAAQQVAGFDTVKGASDRARKMGAIDVTCSQLAEAARGAELIILATPVGAMRSLLQQLATTASPGAVITDVADTKVAVISWAEEYLPASTGFVGGHPIVEHDAQNTPSATLFQQRIYCLTPTRRTPPFAIEKVSALVEALGARARFLEPPEHDGMVAGTTQLPLLASVALLQAVLGNPSWSDASLLANNTLRGVTSPIAGNVEALSDSCLTNSEPLVRWLDGYTKSLMSLRDRIATHDASLQETLKQAQKLRDEWNKPPSH
jgi:prephenate dehydrogenase